MKEQCQRYPSLQTTQNTAQVLKMLKQPTCTKERFRKAV